MVKKEKLKTPDWIIEGYDSPAAYAKAKGLDSGKPKAKTKTKKAGKLFKVRKCPKCGSYDVGLVLSNSDAEESGGTGKEWECKKCKWKGSDVEEEELTENEFMKYLDEKGEEVA